MVSSAGMESTLHPKFLFSFDNRNSLLSKGNKMQQSKIAGIKTGVQLFNKYRIGFGYYGFVEKIKYNEELLSGEIINYELDFDYLGLFGEYIFYKTKRLELSFPFHLAIGTAYMNELSEKNLSSKMYPVQVLESAFNFEFRLKEWIGLGGGFGYRKVFNSPSEIPVNFSSPTYDIKALFFIGPLYRDIRKNFEKQNFYGTKRLGHYKVKPWDRVIY